MPDTATSSSQKSEIDESRIMVLLAGGDTRGPLKTTERAASMAGFPSQQDNIYFYDVKLIEEPKERTCEVCNRLVSVCRNKLRLPERKPYGYGW